MCGGQCADVVRRAVQPVVQALAHLSDRESSRRFTELTEKETPLQAKLENQKDQVEKARRIPQGGGGKGKRSGEGYGGGHGAGGRDMGSVGWTWSDGSVGWYDEDPGEGRRARGAGRKSEEFGFGGSGCGGKRCFKGCCKEEKKVQRGW